MSGENQKSLPVSLSKIFPTKNHFSATAKTTANPKAGKPRAKPMSLLTRYHPGPPPKAPEHPGKRAPLLFKIWYYARIWTQDYSFKSWYYGKYLKSRAWEAKRKAILTRDKHRCTKCGSYGSLKSPLQVHHADYKRARVGYESVDSPYVFTLCRSCHQRHHGRGVWRFLPAWSR